MPSWAPEPAGEPSEGVLSLVPVEAPVGRVVGSLEGEAVEACRVPVGRVTDSLEEEEEALLVREPVVVLSETGLEPLVEKQRRKALGQVQVQVMALGWERVEEQVQELGLG